ncbi:hypothetical protein ACFL6S_22210 [Candidatus Poribacteria bacterium]
MTQYMVLHTLKKSAEEFTEFFGRIASEFARATTAGEMPAKCIKTWNPIPHGRTDYIFCLWEADKPEDIGASLGELTEYVTYDPIEVDEFDWAEMATAKVGA